MVLLDLRQGSVETIYQDNAKYNSIDWQPNTNNLLLAKGNKLLMFNVLGDTQAIDFATSNDISAAFFKHTGNGLYIEQSQLNISLMKTPSLSDNAALARLNYHSANLFPLTNPANRQWLFQSDHSGEQQLYLVDKDNETSIAKAQAGQHFNGFAWSSDGESVAYSLDNHVVVYNLDGNIKRIALSIQCISVTVLAVKIHCWLIKSLTVRRFPLN